MVLTSSLSFFHLHFVEMNIHTRYIYPYSLHKVDREIFISSYRQTEPWKIALIIKGPRVVDTNVLLTPGQP